MVQWEAFLKKRSYSGHRRSRPSGSALPAVLPPLPPSTSASSEAGCPLPSLPPSSLPSEGKGRSGKSKGVSRVGSRGVSLPPSCRSVGEEEGEGGRGGGGGVVASGGECDSVASSLPGGWSSGTLLLS